MPSRSIHSHMIVKVDGRNMRVDKHGHMVPSSEEDVPTCEVSEKLDQSKTTTTASFSPRLSKVD